MFVQEAFEAKPLLTVKRGSHSHSDCTTVLYDELNSLQQSQWTGPCCMPLGVEEKEEREERDKRASLSNSL